MNQNFLKILKAILLVSTIFLSLSLLDKIDDIEEYQKEKTQLLIVQNKSLKKLNAKKYLSKKEIETEQKIYNLTESELNSLKEDKYGTDLYYLLIILTTASFLYLHKKIEKNIEKKKVA